MKYYLRGKSLEHLILNPKKRTAKPPPSTAVPRRHPAVDMYRRSIWTADVIGTRRGGAEPPAEPPTLSNTTDGQTEELGCRVVSNGPLGRAHRCHGSG
jgi:hypothetical protein